MPKRVQIFFQNCRCKPRRRKCKESLAIPLGPFTEQEGDEQVAQQVTITDSQQFSLGPVKAVDKKGNPVPSDNPITFATNDDTLLTVTDNGDGTALAKAVGGLGATQIVISDTVSTATVDVVITAGAEAGLSVAIGVPEEQS